ncbi:unnamed protein product [Darwinula stevensoni]|uniref:Uncharacterized protein n=1 Tax=Darwinula stevensoni TaxID=69355 RepID=A0A7R9AG91_9CRUS|nr:unnamed protein product [Darwinula stevensoni]CAG0903780.1 unnamed protein product [Darwinula stevensoni]
MTSIEGKRGPLQSQGKSKPVRLGLSGLPPRWPCGKKGCSPALRGRDSPSGIRLERRKSLSPCLLSPPSVPSLRDMKLLNFLCCILVALMGLFAYSEAQSAKSLFGYRPHGPPGLGSLRNFARLHHGQHHGPKKGIIP